MSEIKIIVALDPSGGFSKDGKIPWIAEPYAREDLKHFQELTKDSICVMGRHTYTEIAEINKQRGKDINDPLLPNRTSYVLSRSEEFQPSGATKLRGLSEFFDQNYQNTTPIFILGGDKVFVESLPYCTTIHVTIIKHDFVCDKFFNLKYLTDNFVISEGTQTNDLYFVTYKRT